MKVIEAMKAIKRLHEKVADLQGKIGMHCADLDMETPAYVTPDKQRDQIDEWLQAISDSLREILRLRIAIQRTNLASTAVVSLGGKEVTKTFAEWIHRRRDLAALEGATWAKLTDKGLRDGAVKTTSQEVREVKLRRYFDPKERDEKQLLFREEPSRIDAVMEICNATTDLLE